MMFDERNTEYSSTNPMVSQGVSPQEVQAGQTVAPPTERIAAFIDRFVFCKNRDVYYLIATWVIATYLHSIFEYMGYLFIYSPVFQSGKSRLLEVLQLLVHNPSEILISPTESVLFRTARNSTQLLDEVDAWTNKDHLRAVLNGGFRNGGVVPRTEATGDTGYQVVNFSVYAPRALAGIGAFMIEMVRQTKQEKRESFRVRKLRSEAEAIRTQITAWVAENDKAISECYDAGDFPYLEQFRDRTIDVSQPLAAILEVAYHGRTGLGRARQRLLGAIAFSRNDSDTAASGNEILRELLRLAEEEDPLVGTASEIFARCIGLPEGSSEHSISDVLRHYGWKSKSVRVNGEPRYRYVVSRENLRDIIRRYFPDEAGPPASLPA